MDFKLRPARRGEIYARALFFGESGQGKTYSALAVAHHLADLYGWDPSVIAVGDTETVESADREDEGTGSAEKYAGRPCNCNRCHRQGLMIDGFQTMILEDGHRGPEAICRFLEVCKHAGIKIVVLDGITDEWRALLQIVDKVNAQTRGKGDGWSTARPLHNQFVRAILEYPGHVIATCRAKKESRHKKAEEGLGDVIPDQDGNVVYEYDVAVFFKRGTGYVVKTRDDRLENVSSRHPGADLAEGLKRWCDDPRAKTDSAAGGQQAKQAKQAARVPPVAPNTRTDTHANVGGLGEVLRTCEVRIETLRDLGLDELVRKSVDYLENNRATGRGIPQLIANQDAAIAKELRRVAEEEAAAEAAAIREEGQGPDETHGEHEEQTAAAGYNDLPF